MEHRLLDTVVLTRDVPERGLRAGDLGAVVEVYEPDGIEVELVTRSAAPGRLVTLKASDARRAAAADLRQASQQ